MAKQYEGLIGKFQTSIFGGAGTGLKGAATYAAGGAAVGAIGGALTTDDDWYNGAMRGAVTGAAVGGGINLGAKYVSGVMERSGLQSWDHTNTKGVINDAGAAFKDTYSIMNNDANKESMKTFVPVVKSNFFSSNQNFAYRTGMALGDELKKNPKLETDLGDFMNSTISGTKQFDKSKGGKILNDFTDKNLSAIKDASGLGKVNMYNAFGMKTAFDSAYDHIINPTGQLIRNTMNGDYGNITKGQVAAAAFSGYGAYEGYGALKDASNGDYSGAMGAAGMLVAGKLAFAQGANMIEINSYLKANKMTWGGIGKGVTGYIGARRLSSGLDSIGADSALGNLKATNMKSDLNTNGWRL